MKNRLILIDILHKIKIRLNKYLAIMNYYLNVRNYFDSLEKRINLISFSQKKILILDEFVYLLVTTKNFLSP